MWRSLGCRLQLQVFAADGLKFEHGPLRAWALTSMEAKCLHIESYGGNHSGAMQGTSCHTGFVGEAAAAGAADPKPHRLERQLCGPDKKKHALQVKDQCSLCCYWTSFLCANESVALWPNG